MASLMLIVITIVFSVLIGGFITIHFSTKSSRSKINQKQNQARISTDDPCNNHVITSQNQLSTTTSPPQLSPEQNTSAKVINVGDVELSLHDIDLNNLYGFNYNPHNKTLIALCKENNKNGDELKEYDSILKKDEKNKQSIMVWQHFCIFLKMFNEDGDRDSISFSLDPAHKIEKGESGKDVKVKKVYYPENLRWSKAGEVMFDADIFIKTLLYDLHGDITQHIPNYKSYIQKTLDSIVWNNDKDNDIDKEDSNWHRLWIIIDEIEESQDEHSFIINKIKFKINVRHMNVGSDGELHDDLGDNENPLLTEFVNHINKNMDIIQRHSLFLQRLQGVFRALLLAKFVYNNNIPFRMDIVDKVSNKQKQQLQEFGIIFEMPSFVKKAEKSRKVTNGDCTITQTRYVTFSGGINLSIKPKKDAILTVSDEENKTNEVKMHLKSLNKMFHQINESIAGAEQKFNETRVAFEKLHHFKNVFNNNGEYTAVLFPNVLIDHNGEKICEHNDCKQDISWSKSQILDGKSYCQRHYKQHRYPTCTKCDGMMDKLCRKVNIVETRKGNVFHEECFKCEECQKLLKGASFITGSENRIFCSDLCSNKKKLRAEGFDEQNCIKQCIKCKQDINLFEETNIVRTHNGSIFHDACFQCYECQISLKGKHFVINSKNHIFCNDLCSNKKKLRAQGFNDENCIKQCVKCKQDVNLFEEIDIVRTRKGNVFHNSCMECDECQKSLKGESFVMGSENRIFCSDLCSNKKKLRAEGFDEKNCIIQCVKCEQDINLFEETDNVRTNNGNVFHDACFKCYECQISLKGKRYVIDSKNHIFCNNVCLKRNKLREEGFDEQNCIKQCDKCNQNINLFEETDIVRTRKGNVFHDACMKCEECQKSLKGVSFITNSENHIFCNDLCSNKKKLRAEGFDEKNCIKQCVECKQDINIFEETDIVRTRNGSVFHNACFKCIECQKSLKGKGFVINSKNHIFCNDLCSNKKKLRAQRFDEQNCMTKCVKCKQDINVFEETDIIQTGYGNVLHHACLKCNECAKSLKAKQYIMDSENYIFCSDLCSNKKALRAQALAEGNLFCNKCDGAISICNEYKRFGDNIFIHAECIKCDECNQVIEGVNISMDGNQHIFCSKTCSNKKTMRAMSNI